MKVIITLFAMIALPMFSLAQRPTTTTDTLTVHGTCGQCKERIEEAAYSVKGVKQASWNKQTHLLTVVYNTQKLDLQKIANSLALAGHDNRMAAATNKQYATLPNCCKYRDGAKCDLE
jgi:periplasmic mercuric ion binding protein